MRVRFAQGDPIELSDERAEKVKEYLVAGADWVDIDGSFVKASNIMIIEKIPKTKQITYKTPSELGMPNLIADSSEYRR